MTIIAVVINLWPKIHNGRHFKKMIKLDSELGE